MMKSYHPMMKMKWMIKLLLAFLIIIIIQWIIFIIFTRINLNLKKLKVIQKIFFHFSLYVYNMTSIEKKSRNNSPMKFIS